MARNANYALLGYKYQFLKTFHEILCSDDGSIVVCERCEDIDLETKDYELRIQCKYHGTVEKYTSGKIFKPLLEFMRSYALDKGKRDKKYHLFAHFPNEAPRTVQISEEDCVKALNSKDKKFANLISEINANGIDIKAVIPHITIEFGCDIQKLEKDICELLIMNNFNTDEIAQYVLSNGMSLIFDASCNENVNSRKIERRDFLNKLCSIKTILMNKWVKEFCSLEKYLKLKRTAIKRGIDLRNCNRTFIISNDLCTNESELINFIKDLRAHIHSHVPHHVNNRLTLVLNMDLSAYANILKILLKENLEIHTGFHLDEFAEGEFLSSPALDNNRIAIRGIPIRVLHIAHIEVLNKMKPDIYYFLGTNGEHYNLDLFSVTCEELPFLKYNQLKYTFGMRGDFT